MTVTESVDVLIEATAQEILDVLADVESLTQWWDGYQSVDVLERDSEGRPLRTKSALKSGMMEDEQVLAYTWHDDGVSWELESAKLLRAQGARYTLAPEGNGTRVKFEITVDMAVKLPPFMVKKAAEALMKTATEGLSEQVLKARSAG